MNERYLVDLDEFEDWCESRGSEMEHADWGFMGPETGETWDAYECRADDGMVTVLREQDYTTKDTVTIKGNIPKEEIEEISGSGVDFV